MRLIFQKTKTSCGQTCLAMICGIEWEEAVETVGHSHSTRTREMVAALRARGCSVDDHLTVLRGRPLPWTGTYLVKLCYPGNRSHWVVLWEGDIYDPAHGLNSPLLEGWRYTSYLKIRREG